MNIVVPFARPNVDIAALAAISKDALKQRVATTDALIAMVRLWSPSITDVESVREAGSLLRHLSYSYIIVCMTDIAQELMCESKLSVNMINTARSGISMCIVSGNLEEWRTTLINCSVTRVSFDLRELMKKIYTFIGKDGYGQIFHDYRTTRHSDGTSLLEHK